VQPPAHTTARQTALTPSRTDRHHCGSTNDPGRPSGAYPSISWWGWGDPAQIPLPTVLRLSDEAETAVNLARPAELAQSACEGGCDAILQAGGSISHQHGVGIDYREWFEQEVGEIAVNVLRSAKAVLDPAGILNPGILIEAR
jgi:hypothetical protein